VNSNIMFYILSIGTSLVRARKLDMVTVPNLNNSLTSGSSELCSDARIYLVARLPICAFRDVCVRPQI
jgi:hypothetical protein